MSMFVGLALTPGGSTGSDASKQDYLRQGYFSRCHRVGPLPRVEPPQIFTSAELETHDQPWRLNDITFLGESDADVCRFAF